ncbi:MAG: FecR domain-containing protein [SAR324 cluster bacterium]|nr:FecR domain-containing protein [SAR324 cluster bacterium]
MKTFKTAFLLALIAVLGVIFIWEPLFAAAKYGDAIIKKGSMTVVRGGRTKRYRGVNRSVRIEENDLIRVRSRSRVLLKTREKADLTLGSNSVFHVKKWRKKGKTGFARSLFGRFRASITSLFGGRSVNVKTASATIGVKGTRYLVQVTNRGGTMLVVQENIVGLQGQSGPEVNVGENQISITININPATPAVEVPRAVANQISGEQWLDSPPANSAGAGNFVGEAGLVQAGIITEDQLNEGKGTGDFETGPEVFDPSEVFELPETLFDPNAGSDAIQRGRVRLSF